MILMMWMRIFVKSGFDVTEAPVKPHRLFGAAPSIQMNKSVHQIQLDIFHYLKQDKKVNYTNTPKHSILFL